MARLLNATGYVSSVLATVCLVLALIAAPIGEVKGDEPVVVIDPIANNATCNVNCQQSHPTCGNGACRPAGRQAPVREYELLLDV